MVTCTATAGAQTLQGTLDDYRESIASGKGGIFMAVYRGKVGLYTFNSVVDP
jgi:hypothetical protein